MTDNKKDDADNDLDDDNDDQHHHHNNNSNNNVYMLNARGHSVIHGNWEYQNSNPLYFILFIYLLRVPDNICLLYFYINCVNNKMLEYDWFLTAHIYSLILLCNSKTVRFDLFDYQQLVIGQVKSDS